MTDPQIAECKDCEHLPLCQTDYYGGALDEGACIAFEQKPATLSQAKDKTDDRAPTDSRDRWAVE